MRIARDLIEAVKVLNDQEKNRPGRHTKVIETLTKKSKIQQRHFLKEHFPNPKPPQTQRNRAHPVPRHATIKVSHKPTP